MAAHLEDRREGTIPQTIHQKRFVAAFAALALALTAAVSVTVWLAERGKPKPWTEHQIAKNSDPVIRAQEVASLVQARYLGDDGKPLGTVSAGEDLIPDSPGANQVVAVHATATGPPLSFEYGNIVFFKICGRGKDCGFDTSKAAMPQRVVALTANEAAELALRGLKNVPEADAAMVIMPGGILEADTAGGTRPTVVYYVRRATVQSELDNRLPAKFESTVPTPGKITDQTAATLFQDYSPDLFRLEGPKPSPDGANVVYELIPPPAN